MLRRVCTLKGKVGGANRKLCEWMEVHSSTIGSSVEDTMTQNDTRSTRETRAKQPRILCNPIRETREIAQNSPQNSAKQPRNSANRGVNPWYPLTAGRGMNTHCQLYSEYDFTHCSEEKRWNNRRAFLQTCATSSSPQVQRCAAVGDESMVGVVR
jgi:hypothetical protein